MALDFITLIVSVLAWIGWLVAMAGVAATQADGVSGVALSYAWWAVWAQFFILILVCLASCMGNPNVNRLRTYMLAMITVVWMTVANNANQCSNDKGTCSIYNVDALMQAAEDAARQAGSLSALQDAVNAGLNKANDLKTDARVVLAGSILTLIFNYVLIIYWGLTEHGTQGLSIRKTTEPAPTTSEPIPKAEAVAAATV